MFIFSFFLLLSENEIKKLKIEKEHDTIENLKKELEEEKEKQAKSEALVKKLLETNKFVITYSCLRLSDSPKEILCTICA